MVRKQDKYKWQYRESHLSEWNRKRFFDSELRRASLLNDVFKDFEKQYNPLLLPSAQWPPEVVTRFERESGTTNPPVFDGIFMKIIQPKEGTL